MCSPAFGGSALFFATRFLLEEGERTGELADLRTIVLAGMVGREGWSAFAASPEASDSHAYCSTLDRWSRRVIAALAGELGARALFPFGGPPSSAIPAMGAARRGRPSFPDRNSHPSALRAMAFLPRRAGVSEKLAIAEPATPKPHANPAPDAGA